MFRCCDTLAWHLPSTRDRPLYRWAHFVLYSSSHWIFHSLIWLVSIFSSRYDNFCDCPFARPLADFSMRASYLNTLIMLKSNRLSKVISPLICHYPLSSITIHQVTIVMGMSKPPIYHAFALPTLFSAQIRHEPRADLASYMLRIDWSLISRRTIMR